MDERAQSGAWSLDHTPLWTARRVPVNAQHSMSPATGAVQLVGLFLVGSLLLIARCGPPGADLIVRPPAPELTVKPALTSNSSSASFEYADANPRATFKCALDGARLVPCPEHGVHYTALTQGPHSFRVVARLQEILSEATTWSWEIRGGRSHTESDEASTVPTSTTRLFLGSESGADFTLNATAVAGIAPGVEVSIDLSFTNPRSTPITVRSVAIAVEWSTTRHGKPNALCSGPPNLVVVHSLQSEPELPSHSTMTLSRLSVPRAAWPVIMMPNLPVNQDACKNTKFALSFSATATSG